jgi:hypothetical protein
MEQPKNDQVTGMQPKLIRAKGKQVRVGGYIFPDDQEGK